MTAHRVLSLLAAVTVLLGACDILPGQQAMVGEGENVTEVPVRKENEIPALERGTTPAAPDLTNSGISTTTTPQALAQVVPTVQPTETKAILPTATQVPEIVPTHTLTALPTASPTSTQLPPTSTATIAAILLDDVNGILVPDIVIMPDDVRENVRRIYLTGQQFGRNPHAFSKLGDSVTLTDHFLTRFDSGHYNLGRYADLQQAIEQFQGSFSRFGVATRVGLHAWSIFDPLWANKEWCLPDEDMVACEFRLHNPSVLLIKIGSNDSGAASAFEKNLRLLLEYSIDNGVIPILGTKADRFEGPDDRNNAIIRRLAAEYAVPLWDYDLVSGTLPRRGLSGDDVHMTMADADDYTLAETFERGYPVSDLTALMALYEVMREIEAAGDA